MLSHLTGKQSNIARAVISLTIFLFLASLVVVASNQASGSATLPSGTRILVRMVDSVDSETSQPDQRFRGSLETNLMAGSVLVAPEGTTVLGRLLSAESAGRGSGGQLEFDLTDIMINGQIHSLSTESN